MKLNQLSVFLENKPGSLSAPCRLLAQARINIESCSLADTQKFGILRLIVREWDRARALLEKNGYTVKPTDVVAIEVTDEPGGLAAILEALEPEGINVEYMYALSIKEKNKALLVFRFDQPDRAIATLKSKGIPIVSTQEVFERLHSSRQ